MRGPTWSGALVLALLGACARPAPPPPAPPPPPVVEAAPAPFDELYVIVPGPDGTTGSISVTTPGGGRKLLGMPYATARIREPDRIETGVSSEREVRQEFAEALAAQPARPVSFILYFVEGTDALTPESQPVVQEIFAEIARRADPEIVVIGHTDRVGSVLFNDALSRRRAERVREDLVTLGIPGGRIEVAGRGEREPLVPTEDEVSEPRNRRVEISIR